MMKHILAAATAGFVMAGSNFTADAAIVEQIVNLPGIDNIIDGFGPGNITVPSSFNAVFDLFDPSLGTLTGMTISFDYKFELTMDLPATGGGGGGSASGPIFLNGGNENPAPFGAGNGTGSGGAPNSTVVVPWSVTGVYAQPNVLPDDFYELTNFTAATPGQKGSFEFRADVIATPADGVHSTVDLLATSTVKVEYTYTPVPEPATASLLLLGGLAFVRRRR